MQVTLRFKLSGPLLEGKYAAMFDREMLRATQESVKLVAGRIRAKSPMGATKKLKTGIRGRALSPFRGVIKVEGPAAKYAEFRELGRRAGRWPPVEPIRKWVRVILRPPRRELDKVTFLVRRKIGEEGYKGAHFFRSTAAKSEKDVQRIFDRAVRRFERAVTG